MSKRPAVQLNYKLFAFSSRMLIPIYVLGKEQSVNRTLPLPKAV